MVMQLSSFESLLEIQHNIFLGLALLLTIDGFIRFVLLTCLFCDRMIIFAAYRDWALCTLDSSRYDVAYE